MNPSIFISGFIVGTILGSFTKALADRTVNKSSFWGRSYCPRCKKTLRWYDLLPVISYLLAKGSCRYCHKKIEISYLFSEISFGLIVGLMFVKMVPNGFFSLSPFSQSLAVIDLVFKLFAVCILGALFLTDLKTGYLYDRLTIPGIIIALIYLILSSSYKVYLTYLSINNSLIGEFLLPPHSDYFYRQALTAAGPLLGGSISAVLLALFFGSLIILTRGRGMGGGDLKLGVFIGLILGFPLGILGVLVAFILGSGIGLILVGFKKRNLHQTIPFGPFLSVGALIALIWGNEIIDWYLKFNI